MAGHPGTPRFGMNPPHDTKTNDSNGMSTLHTNCGDVNEVHQMINPSLKSREMGTSEGGDPGHYYQQEDLMVEYPSNHDGYTGGNLHNLNLDEKKVLDNFVMSVKVCCAEEYQNISETHGKFD